MAASIFGGLFMAIGAIIILTNRWHTAPGSLIVGVILVPTGLILWVNTVRIKLVIDRDSIAFTNAFGTRKFLLKEIVSYNIEKGGYYLISNTNRQISIPGGLDDIEDVKIWIEQRYKKDDALIVAVETRHILSNEMFGATEEERQYTLLKARRYARILNITAALPLILFFVLPYPHSLSWMLTPVWMLAAFYMLWYFKGLVTINADKHSAYPSVFIALLISCLTSFFAALSIYRIHELSNGVNYLLSATIGLTLILYIIVFTSGRRQASKKAMLFAFVLLFAGYGYGSVTFINCNYDKSKPQFFRLPVVNKHVEHGKTDSYFITVTAWGHFNGPNDINVSRDEFDRIKVYDNVSIYLFPGYLKMPWYYYELP